MPLFEGLKKRAKALTDSMKDPEVQQGVVDFVSALGEAASAQESPTEIPLGIFGKHLQARTERATQMPGLPRSPAPRPINEEESPVPNEDIPYLDEIRRSNERSLTFGVMLSTIRSAKGLPDESIVRRAKRVFDDPVEIMSGLNTSNRLASYLVPRFSPWGTLSDPMPSLNQRQSRGPSPNKPTVLLPKAPRV